MPQNPTLIIKAPIFGSLGGKRVSFRAWVSGASAFGMYGLGFRVQGLFFLLRSLASRFRVSGSGVKFFVLLREAIGPIWTYAG